MKKPTIGILLAAGIVVATLIPTSATAATDITVCTAGCDYTTIPAAVTAANAGDTILVQGNLSVSGPVTVTKAVTITGAPDASVTQTVSAITFLLLADGSSLTNLEITSDSAYPREFIQIGGDNVTVTGNTVYGPAQPLPMSSWVGNRGFVTQGSISGLNVSDNVFHSMRSGAYLNPNGSGTIADNILYNTKGDFLIDNANFTFAGNQAGDASTPSEWSFVIFANTATDRYASLSALSAANGYMSAWDQRTGEQFVMPRSADDCKNGGWTAPLSVFPNQGQCIKFVNTGK